MTSLLPFKARAIYFAIRRGKSVGTVAREWVMPARRVMALYDAVAAQLRGGLR